MALSPVSLGVLLCVLLASASVESGTTLTSNATGPLVVGIDSVALLCTTQIPNADYLWNLDGAALPGDSRYHVTTVLSKANSTLTISPVSINDSGSFTCEAISGSTTETSNAVRLTLTYPSSTVSPKPTTSTTSKPALAPSPTSPPGSSSGGLRAAIANIVIGVVTVIVFIRIGAPC
ncbi:carcinoembryonic antigen-related cell adhesion molecule 6-like [Hyperolius riggenbachi]|uniref:carcinoembryonic antigen-related cell adhesion molecule 6-like n=1 Tax=Hyperolius riggenbachi TaxID=752182 RepID=UPI0035A30B73